MDPRQAKWMGWWFALIMLLLMLAFDFVQIYVALRLCAWIAPGLMGSAADRPAVYAAWIALMTWPLTVGYLALIVRRPLATLLTGDLPPDAPERSTPAKVRDGVAVVVLSVAGALITVTLVVDPGVEPVWPLAAVAGLAPLVLPRLATGVFRLLRRSRRATV